jgi:glycosyltransferase involved in cell wall biosynthesis
MRREEFLGRMISCDVFLFPSLRDGGGAVVVEALAAGKPVVCLDVGGPAVHVTNVCGIKVAPRSRDQAIREIAEALERLYVDKELRRRMGRAARDRAERFYLWDELGERLMGIYHETLKDLKADDPNGEYATGCLGSDSSSER